MTQDGPTQEALSEVMTSRSASDVPEKEVLSYIHRDGLEELAQSGSETSKKMLRLRVAVEALKAGEVGLEDYRDIIGAVLEETLMMKDVMETPDYQQFKADLPPEVLDVLEETARLVDAFAEACDLLLGWDDENFAVGDQGLQRAEAVLKEMALLNQDASELQAEFEP